MGATFTITQLSTRGCHMGATHRNHSFFSWVPRSALLHCMGATLRINALSCMGMASVSLITTSPDQIILGTDIPKRNNTSRGILRIQGPAVRSCFSVAFARETRFP
jgi:hypothetical protein